MQVDPGVALRICHFNRFFYHLPAQSGRVKVVGEDYTWLSYKKTEQSGRVKVVGGDYTWLSYKKREKSKFDDRRKNLNTFVRLFATPGPKMAE